MTNTLYINHSKGTFYIGGTYEEYSNSFAVMGAEEVCGLNSTLVNKLLQHNYLEIDKDGNIIRG